MIKRVNFDDLVVGSIFYTEEPYRQYYLKLKPFEVNGRWYNAEELDSGKSIQFNQSLRFPIYQDDGGKSWSGPRRDEKSN
jgi:hypothetical protein